MPTRLESLLVRLLASFLLVSITCHQVNSFADTAFIEHSSMNLLTSSLSSSKIDNLVDRTKTYFDRTNNANLSRRMKRSNKNKRNKQSKKHKKTKVCCSNVDAAANIRGELYFFKGEDFWRLTKTEKLGPHPIYLFWREFPKIKIDAVFSYSSEIYFLTGKSVLVYQDNMLYDEHPIKLLSHFDLPDSLEKVDAAYVNDDQVYFFRKDQYWKYSLKNNKMQPTYPKKISQLRGIPENLNAATVNPYDQSIYFIKGKKWWKLDADSLQVTQGFPRKISEWWRSFGETTTAKVVMTTTTRSATTSYDVIKTEKSEVKKQGGKNAACNIRNNGKLLLFVSFLLKFVL